MFKLNQEYKAVCGESDPTELEGDARGQAVKILKGMFLYQSHQGNWDEAQEIGSKILEMVPEDEETLQNALCGHWQEGYEAACKENYAKAEDFFQQLTEKRSDIGVIYQNIALAQERQGKKEDAVESWRKALEQLQSELKKNPENEYKKALVLAIHKYTGGKLLDEKQDGSVSGSDKEMGYACIKQGNWKQAASALERAHHTNPDDIDVLCQLGWAYLNTNQNAKAFKMWNMAHKKSGGKSQVVDHLVKGYSIFGKRLKEQRIYNQALVQFKNALKFEPNNLELRAELADTYFQMRNFSTAMREYQKILDVEPRNKAARQGMRESKRLGGIK
ncbi:tetratricopeptide repeat protein [bacterium]|nr:tetratricopeptide repeat protein [bacterium]